MEPPSGPALKDPASGAALRRYRYGCWRSTGVGVVGFAIAIMEAAMAGYPDEGLWNWLLTVLLAIGTFAFVCGAWGLVRAVRMKRLMDNAPWVSRRSRFRIAGGGQPALLLEADAGHPEAVLSVAAFRWRWGILSPCDGRTLWAVGDPEHWIVATPPGAPALVFVKRPWLPWWRKKLRGWALGE